MMRISSQSPQMQMRMTGQASPVNSASVPNSNFFGGTFYRSGA